MNYFQVVKETLEKDHPIQGLEVGETFSVACNTNKLYVWGMNEEYGTYENTAVVKPSGLTRMDKITINNNKI